MTSLPNLTDLLPSTSYTLVYSLPLLLLSFVLTFAGTFLMLDRSRSFPPSADYTALPGAFEKSKKHKFVWFLEGGIGGLACGYTTGCELQFLGSHAYYYLNISNYSALDHLPFPCYPK